MWMHPVIKLNTTRWIAEHDADDSLQFDYFDSATKTHQHCQQSAARLHQQHWLCAGAEIW